MNVVSIVTTYNRDRCLQRSLRSFIEQDYSGEHTMLIFNTGVATSLPYIDLPSNKTIQLFNITKDYKSVGEKHFDALQLITDADLVTHSDVDDLFLPNHISEGVLGFKKGGKLAYKPKISYYKDYRGVHKDENVFEPSIFIDYKYLQGKGYFFNNVKYHDKWLLPLIQNNDIFVDPEGKSTFMYDWSGEIPVHKMSGRPDTNSNFLLSQQNETDSGSGITIPLEKEIFYKYLTQNGLL